jgi:hypothetical protein
VLELRTDNPDSIPAALRALDGAVRIAEVAPDPRPLVIDGIVGV